jgi:hypothetical protein
MREDRPAIEPLTDSPGPEATRDVLHAHYQLVQTALACHAYDDVIYTCHWCLSSEPLAFGKLGERSGTKMYCTERCQLAADSYRRLWFGGKPISVTPDAISMLEE